jgi:DEAD/DEAH box helicase domain-containing protein
MIPPIIARELRRTILDYLETSFALSNGATAAALREFLEHRGQGIFKGPYIDVRLPFRSAGAGGEELPLDVRPGFAPYAHQVAAFKRLSSPGGNEPRHTLVTTGTGSGKTECFLYPVLDHCLRDAIAGKPGIKAIILYPMNALAADQARRLARVIWDHPDLRSRVTAGMYVGHRGSEEAEAQDSMTRDGLVVKRAAIFAIDVRCDHNFVVFAVVSGGGRY